jgi:hypothetical protein
VAKIAPIKAAYSAKKKEVQMPEEIYKPKDAAPLIGTTPGMLSQFRHRGTGPRYILLGTAIRYRRSDLEAFLNERTVDPGAPLPKGVKRAPGGPGRGRKGKRTPPPVERKKQARRLA